MPGYRRGGRVPLEEMQSQNRVARTAIAIGTTNQAIAVNASAAAAMVELLSSGGWPQWPIVW